MRTELAVALCALCIAGGFLAGRFTRAAAPDQSNSAAGTGSAPLGSMASPAPPARVGEADGQEGPATVVGVAGLPPPEDTQKLGERIRQAVGSEFDAARAADAAVRAQQIRDTSLAAAAASDATAVREVAAEIARERAFLVDKARGGIMKLLSSLPAKTPLLDLVGNPVAFGAHFQRRESGPTVDGPSWKAADGVAHGTTLTFPAGSFRCDADTFRAGKEYPRDVLVAGAGMDATLLRLDELSFDGDITNLAFRDCTIDCGDNSLTDLRSNSPITLRLERCRVVGFDMGAGGSVMLDANRAALYASDCRFEAGYGRTSPGFGNLFRVRSGLLARLERCTFKGPFRSVFDADSRATYVFAGCSFEQMDARFAADLAKPPGGVRFEKCVVVPPKSGDPPPSQRPLSDFNPAWPSETR